MNIDDFYAKEEFVCLATCKQLIAQECLKLIPDKQLFKRIRYFSVSPTMTYFVKDDVESFITKICLKSNNVNNNPRNKRGVV